MGPHKLVAQQISLDNTTTRAIDNLFRIAIYEASFNYGSAQVAHTNRAALASNIEVATYPTFLAIASPNCESNDTIEDTDTYY
jgi:hypothetical protein